MRRIEWLLSKMFSGFYTTDSDVSCVYSIVNVIAPEFDVPKEVCNISAVWGHAWVLMGNRPVV